MRKKSKNIKKEVEEEKLIEPIKRTAPLPEEIEKQKKPGIFKKITGIIF